MNNTNLICELRKHLEQANRIPMKDLKKELDIYNNDDLALMILDLVDDGVKNFNYFSKPDKRHYMKRGLEYLARNNIDIYITDKTKIIDKIDDVITNIHEIQKPVSVDPNNSRFYHGYEFLDRLLYMLKKTRSALNSEKYYEKNYHDEKDEEFKFLVKIITEIDDYKFLEKLFDTYPEVLNAVDKNKYTLFDMVIEQYIKILVSEENQGKLAYYQAVLKLFIYSKRCYISDELIHAIIDELKHLIMRINESDLYKPEREKRIYYINELITVLNIKRYQKDISDEINNLYNKYDVHELVPDQVLKEMKSMTIPNNTSYKDLRDRDIFTIDTTGSKTYDDAMSIDKIDENRTRLSIYVPAVADFIPKRSIIDKYIRNKGEAIFLKDKVLPLFPFEICEKLFSLDHGKKRLALTFDIIFNGNEIEDINIYRGLIEVRKNLYYDNCKDTDEGYKLKEFDTKILNNKTKDENNYKIIHTNINTFVQETIAKYIASKQIPFIYRKKETNYISNKLNSIKEDMNITDNTFVDSIISIYDNDDNLKRRYTNIPYGEITSSILNPIRDYASIASQYLILQNIVDDENKIIKLYFTELEDLTEHLDNRHRKNKHFKSDYNQLYSLLKHRENIMAKQNQEKIKVKKLTK